MSFKEDLETIKKNYEIRPIITFDELVETYLIQLIVFILFKVFVFSND